MFLILFNVQHKVNIKLFGLAIKHYKGYEFGRKLSCLYCGGRVHFKLKKQKFRIE